MALTPGTRLGSYEILAPLGAGGMGEVYRARDPRLGRDVAIKVVAEPLARHAQALARFEREARAVAALSHPSIVAIYDVGTDRGITYAVTELLEGETLRSRLARGALPWRQAVEILAPVADGLAAAHAKGIIHRDLKPENIFLTADGRAKVLDFGLARRRPVGTPNDENTVAADTEPGLVLGTVGYMSPEQVRGHVADAPSDIFSLGCVLYEMIAGRRAFARETGAQTMTAILEHQPPSLAECGIDAPEALNRTVARCLEKNSSARIRSAHDLSVALSELLSRPGDERPASVRRPGRRAVLATVAALALCLAAAGAYWFGGPGGPVASIAILPFANDSGNPDVDYLSDGITESLINSLSQVPNLTVMSRTAVFQYKGRDTDAQAAGQRFKVQAVLTGRVVQRGDRLAISAELTDVRDNRHLWGEQYNRSLSDILAVQEDISSQISDTLRLRLTGEQKARLTKRYTQNTEAYQLYLRGRYHWNKKTADGFKKGIEYFEQAIHVDPTYAPAYAGVAALYNNLANYNFALLPPREAWVKAKTAARRALEIDDTLAAAHASLALVAYQWEWDWPAAEREFRRALELDPGSSSTFEPTPSSTYHWYSHYLLTMGRTEESLGTGRRALELDPVDLANNAHQGWFYLWVRQYDRAVEPLKKAIEMDPGFPVAQWYLGMTYEQQGAWEDAIARFQECVRLTGGRPAMLALLAHAHAAANHREEAQAILAQLAEVSTQGYVPSYPIAVVHAALGEREQALTWLERAHDERDSWMNYIALDPRLDTLRGEDRLADLVRRMNLGR